jgi:Transposase DDE domain
MQELSEHLASPEFALQARHPEFPKAFTRQRKLPLNQLVACLISMRSQSQQAMLDTFFAATQGCAQLLRVVSDRAFAKARDHLHMPALTALNDLVVARADAAGVIQRWQGLRVVAGDASVLRPAIRACQLKRSAAAADQRLFALYLPGAELTLHAQVYSALDSERAMLMSALDKLGPDDVLVLDRGYPAAWLVALLNERNIRFVIRCDSSRGWGAVKTFLRSNLDEAGATLNKPDPQDIIDWDCPEQAPTVRLVRQVSTNGQVRVLATNLDAKDFACACFGDLYHQRWRIEEAFKRLKHRLKLEAVSGLSQQALIVDVAAKILADNLTSLMCEATAEHANMPAQSRLCNRSYATQYMQRALPAMIQLGADILALFEQAIHCLSKNTQRRVKDRSQPRKASRTKPHPSMCYKT